MNRLLWHAGVALLAVGPSSFAMTFTGSVPADFTGTEVVSVPDVVGDVAVPGFAPPGTVSGWDLMGAAFDLDRTAAQLHVGLDFFGVGGDADGDGVDGFTSPWLAGLGGSDYTMLDYSESICIAFDFDQNGQFDVIAGMGEDDGVYRVAQYVGPATQPYRRFGALLPAFDGGHFYAPSVASPDFELTLNALGTVEDLDAEVICFNVYIFAGSLDDDGIGEDNIQAEICFTDEGTVEAVLPTSADLVRAYPNPFNPATTLAVELAATGQADLSVFNLAGQKVATLASGLLGAGTHHVAFDASALPSGLYLARLQTESGVAVTRLMLAK